MRTESVPVVREQSIPEAGGRRLPVYLRALVDLAESGAGTVSSDELAEAAGVNSAKVRKDLSTSVPTRSVGYDVAYLIHQIRRSASRRTGRSSASALGQALANYGGFAEQGSASWRSSTPTRPGWEASATSGQDTSTTCRASSRSSMWRSG